MLNIALDGTVIRPPLSGVHHAVEQEILALLAARAEQTFTCLAQSSSVVEQAASHAHVTLPGLPAGIHQVWRRVCWQQLQLPSLLRHCACDRLLALAYTAPRRCPIPYTVQVHDSIALRFPELCSRLNAWHMRTLMPAAVRGAEHVLTSSSSEADHLNRLLDLPFGRISCVPLGVDPLFLNPPEPSLQAAWENHRPYILFVGNLEPKKGLDVLIQAYRDWPMAAQVKLLVAGRSAWKCEDIEQDMNSYDGPGEIVRLGYVDRQELPALYQAAEAYVMPSSEEGFGLPILEAMACGSPVVHSDHPVLMETAGGHGSAFRLGDAADLSHVLTVLLDSDEEREQRAKAAQEWARTRTWSAWVDGVAAATGYF